MEFDENRASLGKDLAFVVIDLLRIDNQTLFDVPLLERKRLLEGVVQQSPLVRLSPWVTPPIHRVAADVARRRLSRGRSSKRPTAAMCPVRRPSTGRSSNIASELT